MNSLPPEKESCKGEEPGLARGGQGDLIRIHMKCIEYVSSGVKSMNDMEKGYVHGAEALSLISSTLLGIGF